VAIASTNISTAVVNTELGSPYTTPRLVSLLCKHANAGHPFSFYGPGGISTDASKNAIWVAPTGNYKLGDFRLYNRTASTPSGPGNFTHYWGPSGSTSDVPIVCFPNNLNVLDAYSSAYYLTYKAYLSTANRTAETSVWDSFTEAWSYTTPTLYNQGHTRNQSRIISSTHIGEFTAFATLGTTDPDYIYFDVYLSDISGNRRVNLGTSVSGGYFTLTLRKNSSPQMNASGNCVSRSGYTGTFTNISNSSTECSSAVVTQSLGSTAYSFYMTAVGIQAGSYNIYPTSCTVVLYHYNGSGGLRQAKTLGTTISMNPTTAKQITSGAYGALANSWQYNDYGVASITAVNTWGTAGSC